MDPYRFWADRCSSMRVLVRRCVDAWMRGCVGACVGGGDWLRATIATTTTPTSLLAAHSGPVASDALIPNPPP